MNDAPPDAAPPFRGWRGCDACGETIDSPAEAVLALPPEYLLQRRAGIEERDRARAAGETSAHVSDGLVPWDWVHAACLQPRDPEYVIAGDSFDTLPKAMARTLQLLDREWFLETAWEDAIRRFYDVPTE
jgi:hypothetical protein